MDISCFLERNASLALNYSQIPCLSCGFSIYRTPNLGIVPKSKHVNLFPFLKTPKFQAINAVLRSESDTELLEKEFGFKPSFDEQLKVMESVIIKRKKRKDNSTRNDVSSSQLLERDAKGVTIRKFGGSFRETMPSQVKQDESIKKFSEIKFSDKEIVTKKIMDKSKVGLSNGSLEEGYAKNGNGSVQVALKSKESETSFKTKRNARVNMKNDRWVKNQTGSSKELEKSFSGQSVRPRFSNEIPNSTRNDVSSLQLQERGEKSVTIRKFGGSFRETIPSQVKQDDSIQKFRDKEIVNKKTMDTNKMGLSNGSLETGYAKNGNGSVQVALRNKESETSFKTKRNVGVNMKNERWVKNQIGRSKELEESFSDQSGRPRFINEIPNLVGHTGKIMEVDGGLRHDENFKGASFSIENNKLKGRTFEIEKRGSKSSDMHKTYVRNHAQGEKFSDQKFVLKNGYNNSSRAILAKFDGKNMEMERAAFKTYDVFNDVMDKPRVTRLEMEERIQKLANWLNGADINIPEWMFSNMMQSAKIRFSDHSILRIIQILGKLGNWRRVLQVLEWIQMRERFKSHKLRYIYTAALDVLGKARRPVEALNVFLVMQQQMSSYPDLVAYHCIAVTLGQAGHMKELFDVIDCMRSPPKKKFQTGVFEEWDPRLEPDVVVYNAVLNACVQRKQWEGANWVLQQLKQQGQQPSCTTYGLVMEVMFACGKYNLVHEFFRKVQKSSNPNVLTYKVLVNTLWREGKTNEAVLAVEDMERRGIVGSASLYYDLARCLCSVGRCHEALMQIEKICKVANKPLVVTYTGLIQACLEFGNIHDGAYIFSQMRRFCCPNLVTYNIMLKGYVKHGMFEEAKQLFQNMLKDGNHILSKSDYKQRVIPDIYTFNTMLDACFADKRWDDFGFFYIQMLHHGYNFNAKRHLQMILDASRSGKGELLETTWKHLAQADQIQPLPLILERFCMKLEKGDYSAAISCVTSIPRTKSPPLSKMAWLKLFKENAQRFQKDTLAGFINEVSILLGSSDLPDPIFQNLITAFRDFFSTFPYRTVLKP